MGHADAERTRGVDAVLKIGGVAFVLLFFWLEQCFFPHASMLVTKVFLAVIAFGTVAVSKFSKRFLPAKPAPTLPALNPNQRFDCDVVTREHYRAVAAGAAASLVVTVAAHFVVHLDGIAFPAILGAIVATFGAVTLARTSGKNEGLTSWVWIADDGLVLEQMLGRRFVPFRDVVRLEAFPRGMKVSLKDRDGGRQIRVFEPCGNVAAFEELLCEARARYVADAAQAGNPMSTAALLTARAAAESASGARESVRVGEERNGYREAPIGREDLWQLVEASATPAAVRAVAARALLRAPEAEDRVRVAAIGTRIADPEARAALTDVMDSAAEPVRFVHS